MNLLLVEDEQFFRNSLRLRVAEAGEAPNILEAATLSDALAILGNERVDAALSDGAFPPAWGEGMDDLCRWATSWRTLHEACKRLSVPFVVLSGDPAIVEAARSLSVPAFSKPYET